MKILITRSTVNRPPAGTELDLPMDEAKALIVEGAAEVAPEKPEVTEEAPEAEAVEKSEHKHKPKSKH